MFYAKTLTDEQALEIAEAYFKAGRDPRAMAPVLGVAYFDARMLGHPLVKRSIVAVSQRMRKLYSLEDHLDKLQEIRDMALSDGNYKVALTAEVAVGKAAGLYENIKGEQEETSHKDPAQLSSAEIRQKLAQMGEGTLKLIGLRDGEDSGMSEETEAKEF